MLSRQERRSLGEIGRALAMDGFSLPSHLLPVRRVSLQRLAYDVVIVSSVILAAVCFMLAGSGGLHGGWVATALAAASLTARLHWSSTCPTGCRPRPSGEAPQDSQG